MSRSSTIEAKSMILATSLTVLFGPFGLVYVVALRKYCICMGVLVGTGILILALGSLIAISPSTVLWIAVVVYCCYHLGSVGVAYFACRRHNRIVENIKTSIGKQSLSKILATIE